MAKVKTEVPLTAQRIAAVVDYMRQKGMADTQGEAVKMIGANETNASKLLLGHHNITIDHLQKLCEITGASADFILGFTNVMMRSRPHNALDLLKEAVKAVENELKKTSE